MRRRPRHRRIPSGTADRRDPLTRPDDVAWVDGNRSRVRVVEDPVLRGTVDIDVSSAAQTALRLPVGRKGNDDARRDAEDVDRLTAAIVELVLIAIVDEDVVARVAFAVLAVEPVVAVRLIAAAVRATDRLRPVPLERKSRRVRRRIRSAPRVKLL